MAFSSIKATAKGGKDFEIAPAGVHFAICTQIVHVGLQRSPTGKFGDKEEVYLQFELPDIRHKYTKDGKEIDAPAVVRRKFGLSLSEKSHLRPFLEAWRGKPFTSEELEGFEIAALAGKVCQLQVIHEASGDGKKTYANIAGAFGLVKEQREGLVANPKRADPWGEVIVYSPNDTSASGRETYQKLPEWLREIIDRRVIPQDKTAAESVDQSSTTKAEDFNDDIPF